MVRRMVWWMMWGMVGRLLWGMVWRVLGRMLLSVRWRMLWGMLGRVLWRMLALLRMGRWMVGLVVGRVSRVLPATRIAGMLAWGPRAGGGRVAWILPSSASLLLLLVVLVVRVAGWVACVLGLVVSRAWACSGRSCRSVGWVHLRIWVVALLLAWVDVGGSVDLARCWVLMGRKDVLGRSWCCRARARLVRTVKSRGAR